MADQAPAALVGAVRLVFQLEDGEQVGHIAFVTDSSKEQGIFCELITLPNAGEDSSFWLSLHERGLAWDWLRDVRIRVSYLEDDEDEDGYEWGTVIVDEIDSDEPDQIADEFPDEDAQVKGEFRHKHCFYGVLFFLKSYAAFGFFISIS